MEIVKTEKPQKLSRTSISGLKVSCEGRINYKINYKTIRMVVEATVYCLSPKSTESLWNYKIIENIILADFLKWHEHDDEFGITN